MKGICVGYMKMYQLIQKSGALGLLMWSHTTNSENSYMYKNLTLKQKAQTMTALY